MRFQGKYYSVSEEYLGKPVTVIGNSCQISIYHAGKLVEVHERLKSRTQFKSTKRHHLKPWEQACNNEEGLLKVAAKIGPSAQAFVRCVLSHGDGFIDFRRIWGVLYLEKKYSREEIDAACAQALECSDLSYRAVVRFITAAREQVIDCSSQTSRPRGKFQHDLAEYSQMLFNLKPIGGIYEQ